MKEEQKKNFSCCDSAPLGCSREEAKEIPTAKTARWITGKVTTPVGEVPVISTKLSLWDVLGSWRARWGIRRMNYKITPGLYAVGTPQSASPVFVTANYRMSFDRLRKKLSGLDAWLMILDTKGINVWCSAGKGTFGTDEVVNRIAKTGLAQIVSQRTLILPQLSAPGVAAHEVTKRSGFKIVYGPLRASDIPEFLQSDMKASPDMRLVRFNLLDRLVLIPMELVGTLKIFSIILAVLILSSFFLPGKFSFNWIVPYLGAILTGCVLVPILLPWIPGSAFAFKGWLMGILWALVVNIHFGWLFSASPSWKQSLVNFLVLPALSSYVAMNFTGATTFTSLSGVKREIKISLPLIIFSAGLGVVLMILKLFVSF